MRYVGTEKEDPMGEEVSCIGEYRDLSQPESCLPLAMEMIAQPTWNQTILKNQARTRRKERSC